MRFFFICCLKDYRLRYDNVKHGDYIFFEAFWKGKKSCGKTFFSPKSHSINFIAFIVPAPVHMVDMAQCICAGSIISHDDPKIAVARVIELASPLLMPVFISWDEATFALQMFTLTPEWHEHNHSVMFPPLVICYTPEMPKLDNISEQADAGRCWKAFFFLQAIYW